jgi:hypothetical protein
LYNATRGISELITRHGYINVDFADVRTVMREMGDAIMGSGVGRGEHRASIAAEQAISSPLLEGVKIQGAQGVLVNITGGRSMSLLEVSEATQIIHDAAGDDANIIFGAVLDDSMDEEIMVTVIATGFNTRPKYSGGLSLNPGNIQLGNREIEGVSKPRVERINPPMEETTFTTRQQPIREMDDRSSTETIAEDEREEIPMPKIERMYQPRGTLTEKERPATFERQQFDLGQRNANANANSTTAVTSNGTVAQLTPKSDTRHVHSGPRDLKDFDQPAYLRRGISLPPMDEATTIDEEPQAVMQDARSSEMAEAKPVRDDRPAFLKRIMD